MAVSFAYFIVWCLLATWCTELGRTETVPPCVSVYHEFEEAAITNNPGNVHSLFSVLHTPNYPLPFSVVILYQVQLPNGTTQRVSCDTGCSNELWMWTYSPVFLWLDPSLLNKYTLYALNGLRDWVSPTVTLTVPLPCQNVSYNFLSEMTMAANSYALGEVKHKRHLGFVLYGCGKTVEQSDMYPFTSSSDHHKYKWQAFETRYFLVFSSLFQIVFTFLTTSMLLNRWLSQVAVTPFNLPTQVYSQFWAFCTAASICWATFVAVDLYSIITTRYQPRSVVISLALILLSALIEVPVAVYFAKKYTIAVPGVYLFPAKVVCCGKKKISAFIVRMVFLLMTLMAIQLASMHCVPLLLAFAAAPFNIGSTIATLLFVFFATVHILAVLFALPSLCRQPVAMGMVSRGEKCHVTVQAMSLVILLIAIFCFSIVVARSGRLINIDMNQEGFLLALSKVVLPLTLGIISMLLRKFSNMWWETLASRRLSAISNEFVDEPMNSRANYNAI